ncbi:MAG: VCBS repeat-containing protein [Archangiaceae bacterium]|nr:VCBS repeat-containing protein [Archangiaceae bacterium]
MSSLRAMSVVVVLWGCGSGYGPLALSKVSPEKGSAAGGETVVLTGTGFSEQTVVKMNGRPARITGFSQTELTVVTPRTIAGPAMIEVSRDDDSHRALDGGYTFEAIGMSFVDVAGSRFSPLPADGAGVLVVDGDGDGRADLFQAAHGEGVLIYSGAGAGAFASPQVLVPRQPAPVADGGLGDAGFIDAGVVLRPALDVRALASGDFDGDGKVDLLVLSGGRAQAQLWRGKGALSFTQAPAEQVPPCFGLEPSAVVADLDGDDDLDLISLGAASAAAGASQVQLLLNDGHGRFSDVTASNLGAVPFDAPGVAVGDLDGDGKVDLFFSGSTDVMRLYLGDGHGVFQRSAPDALPADSKPLGGVPSLGDFDLDGALDVFMPAAGQDRVLFNDGTGHFDDVSTIFLGAETGPSAQAQVVDLDLDGAADVLVLDRPGRLRAYRNDGQGRLFDYTFELLGNDGALANTAFAVGDVDGDGDDDVWLSRADLTRPALFLNWSPLKPSSQSTDGDSVPDDVDNCPKLANPEQANAHASGFGCRSATACKAATGCELKMFGASAYLFCRDTPLAWAEAQAKCRARGGDLVTIDGAEESAWLKGWGGSQGWIGLNDLATEGVWAWSSGASLGFTRWASMQPDDSMMKEDCVSMIGDTGAWNDDLCATAKQYLCETARAPKPSAGDACRVATDGGW